MTVCSEIQRDGRDLGRNSAHFRGRDNSRLERIGFPCDVNLASGAEYSVVSAQLGNHYPSPCPDLPLIGAQPFSEGRQDRASSGWFCGEALDSNARSAHAEGNENKERGGFRCGLDLSWLSGRFWHFRLAGKPRANRQQLVPLRAQRQRWSLTAIRLRARLSVRARTWPIATRIQRPARAASPRQTRGLTLQHQDLPQGAPLREVFCVGEASVALHRRARRA